MSLGARSPTTDTRWKTLAWVNGALQRRPSAQISGGGRCKNEASHYGDCGNVNGGDSELPQDTFSWTALILQQTNAGKSRHALRFYEQMQRSGVEPSSYTFVAALKACRRLKDLESTKQIHLEVVRSGLELDMYVGTMLVDVYSRCDSPVDARRVFDKMPHRNVVCWNSVISGYVQVGDSEEALQLFSRMQQEGVSPNNQTFAGALKACSGLAALEEWNEAGGTFVKRRCLEKVRAIHSQLVKQRSSEFSVFVGTLLVDVYVKCGSLVDARHVFENMPHRDVVSWNILILAYAQMEGGEEALQLYTRMQQEGLQPNDRTFVAALKACGSLAAVDNWKDDGMVAKRQSLDQVKAIHAQVVKSGCELTQFVGTMLVDVYGKCGSLVDARHVFERIPHRNVVCWTAMILGYAQMEEGDEALQLFARMQYEGVAPNDRTFVAALKACSNLATSRKGDAVDVIYLKKRCLEQVLAIHTNIVDSGVELDVFVGTMLLDAYAKCGSVVNARRTFEQMSHRNVVSWNSMILGHAQMEEGDKALRLYTQMQKEGLVPDERTFVGALKACSTLAASGRGNEVHHEVVMKRCLQQVKAIHSQVRKSGCEAVVFVGTMLVDAYAKCGSLVDARSVFEQMPHRNVVSWNAIILGYSEMDEGEEALHLYARMQQEGIAPDDGTFVGALKACGVVAGLEKGKEIHAEMLNRLGFGATDLLLGTTLIDMYGKCGSMETAQLIFDALPRRDVVTWSALIAGYAQQGDSGAVFEKFQRMRQEAIQPDGITFLSVLAVCSHVGLLNEGQMYFEAMTRDCGIIPTIDHYTCVIDLLGRAGQVEKAMNMAMVMPKANVVVWKTVLGACRKWRNVEIGRRAFESALMLDRSDAATYVLMSNIYAAARMWEDMNKIKAMRMKTRALKQPGQSWWTDRGGIVHTFMVGDQKHRQIQEINSKLRDLELEMKKGGYTPHFDSVLQDISNDEKEAALCGHSERLAVACALLNTPKGTTIRVVKNLRVCEDCHSVIALISQMEQRTIICRDARRFHVYKEGNCSCGGYW